MIEHKQIVAREQQIKLGRMYVEHHEGAAESLDSNFPQSSGYQCQFCAFKRVCFEGCDPATSPDLYQARVANHPVDVED